MIGTIYIEETIADHPRTLEIIARFPGADRVSCRRYGEVFNPRAQNFRLQKKNPALILAEKHGKHVLPAPPEYQIGADRNYYFSHMLNCLYDCRYCFLQGMYQSANYVLFVNYEDFEEEIVRVTAAVENRDRQLCFFSGYDCDSLALESITGFAGHFLPFFERHPDSWLELRTKSVQTRVLTGREPMDNVIVSFTLSPDIIAREVEHGAPSLARRLDAVVKLAERGWALGLRFDPLIPWPGFDRIYPEFFRTVFEKLAPDRVHSATIGPMRFPSAMYEKIVKLYPDDRMLAMFPLEKRDGQASFPPELEERLVAVVRDALGEYLPGEKIFRQG